MASKREEQSELPEGPQSCVAGIHEKGGVCIPSLRDGGTGGISQFGDAHPFSCREIQVFVLSSCLLLS